MRGFACVDGLRRHLWWHQAFSNYSVDILEVEDLAFFRHGAFTSYACNRCCIKIDHLGNSSSGTPQRCVHYAASALKVAGAELIVPQMAKTGVGCLHDITTKRGNPSGMPCCFHPTHLSCADIFRARLSGR